MDVVELTAELVRLDTTSGAPGEVAGLEFVAHWLRERGLEVAEESQSGRPAALLATAPSRAEAAGPPRPSAAGDVLLFAGHIDVVPVSDAGAWPHPPFSAVVEGGRLHGRGASDMKSGLAAAMLAVAGAARRGEPVALGVTTGEELGCLGAPALLRLLGSRGLLGRVGAVVVPESTGGEVVLGHRGATWLTLVSRGAAAHGSTPERGVNAVLRLAGAVGRAGGMPLRVHPDLGAESVNVGSLRGGTVPNIVPDLAEATVDLRTVAPAGDLVDWWRAIPGVDEVRVDLSLPAVWTDRGHPFVHALGAPVADAPASYFTDASVLAGALGAEIPIVVWGPGDPAVVHTVGESVDLGRWREAERLFRRAAAAWSASTGP